MAEPEDLSRICPLCFPGAEVIGEVLPELVLGKHEDKYFLIWDPCHKDHECYEFGEGVEPRPDPGYSDEEIEADPSLFDEEMDWMKEAEKNMRIKINVDEVMNWSEALSADGYKREDGSINLYLYDKCGRTLQEKINAGA